ncbi:MAG TPA: tetratricopeptide repeat protein [Bacteroidales bacterium]|nr:tetratricopeptide repeat protein [Bacteroidales bacterium]
MNIRITRKAGFLLLLVFLYLIPAAQQTRYYEPPEATYRMATDLVANKQYGAAREVFLTLIDQLPPNEELMRMDAAYYIALADYKLDHPEARQEFEDFLLRYDAHTKTNLARLHLGFITYDGRRYKQAIDEFEKVEPYHLTPKVLPEYLYKLGYSYLQTDNYEKAREVLFPVLNTPSDYQQGANYYYAQIAYLQQDYDEALKYFSKVDKNSEIGAEVPFYLLQINYVRKDFDAIVSAGPDLVWATRDKKKQAEAARVVAEAFYQKGDYAQALEYFGMYDKNIRRTLSREEQYQIAFALYQTGKYQEAVAKFEKVAGPKDALSQNAYYHLADSYLKTDKQQFAQSAFYNAWQLNGDEKIKEDALFNYAKLSYELAYDPFGNSLEALMQYVNDYPDSPRTDEAMDYLTNLFLSTKDYQAAINAIERMHTKNNVLKTAYQRITYQLAVQNFNAGRWEEALANFRKSLANTYNRDLTTRAKYWMAETYYQRQQYSTAIEHYEDFMTAPGSARLDLYPLARYQLGYSYFNLKHYDNALAAFRQFVNRPGKSSEEYVSDALMRMGDCYFVTKNYRPAIEQYDLALEKRSRNADYAMFQKALSQGALGNDQAKLSTLNQLIQKYPASNFQDDAYYEMAETYLLTNNNDEALTRFDDLIRKFPNSSYVVKSMQRSALVHYNQNHYDEAIQILKKLVKDYQGTDEARESLATIRNIYMDKNEIASYFKYAETVPFASVTASEQDSLTWINAENLYRSGRCENAVKALDTYLDEFPNGAFMINASYYRAECNMKLANREAALGDYMRIAQAPKSRYTEHALVQAAILNDEAGNTEAALENYQQLENMADNPANVTTALAGQMRAYHALQQTADAMQAARRLLQLENIDPPLLPEANYIIGVNAWKNNDLQTATPALEKTVALSDGARGAEAKYLLAEIQFQQKNLAKAENLIFELSNDYPAQEYWKAKGFIMLAEIYAATDNEFQARQTLQSIIDNYPGQDLRDLAAQKLRQIDGAAPANDTTPENTNPRKNRRR